jgi:hypothetical protein
VRLQLHQLDSSFIQLHKKEKTITVRGSRLEVFAQTTTEPWNMGVKRS